MDTTTPVPGWYDDPVPGAPQGRYRYWNGVYWTDDVAAQPGAPMGQPAEVPGRKRSPLVPVLIGVVALVVLAAAGAFFVSRPSKSYPKAWDPQVAPIATQVAKLRGLDFEHPVPVRYLTPAQFKNRVGVDDSKLSAADKRRIKDLEGTYRAFGLIDANTDLLKSFDTIQRSGVAAFYDPDAEEIVIPSTGTLNIDEKATLAHELTHVLQDQHFDLPATQHAVADSDTASSDALKALVEGDAERIKFAYLRGLPQADRDAYDAAENTLGDDAAAGMASAPEIFKIEFGKPYQFGPEVLKVLTAKGGNEAVNDALRQHSATDAIFLDPAEALKSNDAVSVDAPKLGKGETQIGKADTVGAFDLYMLLASRVDRQVALDAADTWRGDRYVSYRSGGRVCVRATFETESSPRPGLLPAALDAWAATMPGATVTRGGAPFRTTLTSCDQGAATRAPDPAKLQGATSLLSNRDDLLATLLSDHAPLDISECASRGFAKDPIFVSLVDRESDTALTAAEGQQLRDALGKVIVQCRNDPSSA